MDPNRKKSQAILDAYVAAKEIKLFAACTDSRSFDPLWLYDRCLAMPDPPDDKERRHSARALIEAGHAMLLHGRPDLAGDTFDKAYLLLRDTKSGMLRARAMAGVLLCWERMGKPDSGNAFISRALSSIEDIYGDRAKARQEKQLAKAVRKRRQVKLPEVRTSPLGDYMPPASRRRD